MGAPFKIKLPILHAGQVKAFKTPGRFKAGRCGRRFGKTDLAKVIMADCLIKGQSVGYFAPAYKYVSEVWVEFNRLITPIIETSNKMDGVIRTVTNGKADFWTLENENAGRSRKYHKIIIDEAAIKVKNMLDIWEGAIRPTLLDYRGSAWVLSTPKGEDPDNFFWRVCRDPKYGFTEFHAPTWDNPYIPADEIDVLKKSMHPLMFRQEIEAEFIDWSGVAFFALTNLLVDGQPVPIPFLCNGVFAVIDTALKSGKEHDATAVTYFSSSHIVGHPLVVLDYDILSIDGDMLESWLPTVFQRLEVLAKECRALSGALGAFIEDKGSGTVLIQQAQRKGLPARALDTAFTAQGKDERAMSISGYVSSGKVKICQYALEKVIEYKGQTRNHFVSQVTGFRLGDPDTARRADDLLDTFVYGVSAALGDSEGF